MSVYKDKIIVADLEATCWEGYTAPPGQENEVIEIGVCLYDLTEQTISAKRSILVQPTHSVISEFCTRLTTISPALVEAEGITFAAACHMLEQVYNARNRIWASWGAYDRQMLHDQCKRRGVRYPFSDQHINLKRVYADFAGERMGMAQALAHSGLELEGTHHRGHDDAWNSARLLLRVLQEKPAALRKWKV